MLSKSYIENILDYAVSCGADYAEVFYEDTGRIRLNILNDELTECTNGRECGIGIRIFMGLQSEYLYSADTSEETVFRLLKERWKARRFPVMSPTLGEVRPHKVFGCVRPSKERSLKWRAGILKDALLAGMQEEPCVVQGNINYLEKDQWVQIANSEGVYAQDHRVGARAHISMTAEEAKRWTAFVEPEEKERRTAYVGPGAMMGAEFLEKTDLAGYARSAAQNARSMLGAKDCPVGVMPVIIAGGFGGLFFHEACGHSLEGSAVSDGCSEFAGMLGKRVASDKVTLIDDGRMPGEWGSLGVDDEGVLTRKNVLIERGIVTGFLLDRLNAKRMHMEPTGSCRRASYRFAPTSRMTNTYIQPGRDRFTDMLRSVEKGIFVKNINGGSVDPVTGEFNFNTEETYLIEHGSITYPLTSVTLIGTGREILSRVDMVSDDFSMGQGYCYAGSGTLPVGVGQPAVRIAEMTVGGRKL